VVEVGERFGNIGLHRLDTGTQHHDASSYVLVLRDHLEVVPRHGVNS